MNTIDRSTDSAPIAKILVSSIGGFFLLRMLLQWNRKGGKREANDKDYNTEPAYEHPLFI